MVWSFQVIARFPTLLEGPTWDGQAILFSEVAASRIHRYVPATGECSVLREGTGGANGLVFGADGYLYACEGRARRVVRYEGEATVVIARTFDGERRLNSPNDLYLDRRGGVWFSDPRYGPERSDLELEHESVYVARTGSDGLWRLHRATYETTRPNGILVSDDLRTVYVAQSHPGEGELRQLWGYSIRKGDALGHREVLHDFSPHRGIDGMCFDAAGNIVATAGWRQSGPGPMIYVVSPRGSVLERHLVPEDRPTNCTFGDNDLRSLYVTTASGYLLRARTDRQGRPDDPRVGAAPSARAGPG